jgi:hypothetical protein
MGLEVGEAEARYGCGEALPSAQHPMDSVVAISVAGAYVRKAAYHRSESGSSLLSVGGRKSREAGVQPRGSKSVKARLVTAAERHCQVRSGWRATSWPSAQRVRTCGKQPITLQKAVPPCSVSVEGRVVKPECNHRARNP